MKDAISVSAAVKRGTSPIVAKLLTQILLKYYQFKITLLPCFYLVKVFEEVNVWFGRGPGGARAARRCT